MQQVEQVTITKIKLGDRFRKDMGDLSELSESIKEKGLIQPITLDWNYKLLAGGRRFAASKLAGLVEVPAIRRKSTSEIDAREIELFENIHRKDFTWQERVAAESALFNLKISKDPQWTLREQAAETNSGREGTRRRVELAQAVETFPQLAIAKTEDEAWKAYKGIEEKLITESLSRDAIKKATKGIRWANDHYKIGDALAGMEGLAEGMQHFAEVDPPYAVALDKKKSRNSDTSKMDEYTELAPKDYLIFISTLAMETYRALDTHSFAIWWYGWDWHHETLAVLREAGFHVPPIPAIWTKGSQGQTASPDTMLGSCHEPFFICRKGMAKLAKPGRSNVFDYTPLAPSKKIHPTEKPPGLMDEILATFTFPGQRVVIPLLGSGSTLRACYRTGRTGFGWDLSDAHKKRFLVAVAEEEKAGSYDMPKK